MKILLITDLYPVRDDELTTPKTLYDFVQGWKQLGHDVKVIKPNFIFNSFIRKKPFYKTGWYGDIYNVNYWLPFLGNVKQKLKNFYVKDFEPDIVIAHMPSGILLADKLGIPFSVGIHCSDITVLTNPIYALFKNRMLKALGNAQKIFCRSHQLVRKLLSLYPNFECKTYAAPSGINEKFIIEDFSYEIEPKKLKVLTCANFKKRKNIDKVIIALREMEDVELTIIGDGQGKKALERLSNKPRFMGYLEHEKVLCVMQNNDIFILPSVNETFGMVYLEAMASGCIPICAINEAIDGIIISGENGFTVEPSVEAIRILINKIKAMDKEQLNTIRKNALNMGKQYTQKSCCENYLKMLSGK